MSCDGRHLGAVIRIVDRLAAGNRARRENEDARPPIVDPVVNAAIARMVGEHEDARLELTQCRLCSTLYEILKKESNHSVVEVEGQAQPLAGFIRLDAARDGRHICIEESPVNSRPRRPVHTIPTIKITDVVEKPYEPSPSA